MRNVLTGLVGSVCVLLIGCGQPVQQVSSDPVCLPQMTTEAVMESAQAVLTGMQFHIEKYDFDAGYIRTRPLSGAQFFQLFRSDNASAYAAAESNLHSLRRVAELEVTPFADRVCVQCRVSVQQLSIPEVPISGTQSLAAAFTNSSRHHQSLQLDDTQQESMEWLDRGTDRALEQRIIERIKERIQKDAAR